VCGIRGRRVEGDRVVEPPTGQADVAQRGRNLEGTGEKDSGRVRSVSCRGGRWNGMTLRSVWCCVGEPGLRPRLRKLSEDLHQITRVVPELRRRAGCCGRGRAPDALASWYGDEDKSPGSRGRSWRCSRSAHAPRRFSPDVRALRLTDSWAAAEVQIIMGPRGHRADEDRTTTGESGEGLSHAELVWARPSERSSLRVDPQ